MSRSYLIINDYIIVEITQIKKLLIIIFSMNYNHLLISSVKIIYHQPNIPCLKCKILVVNNLTVLNESCHEKYS